jgi:acetoin utilization deacetylase AcuC-like enzyme
VIDVFYRELPPSIGEGSTAFQLRKYRLVHEDWRTRFAGRLAFPEFSPASADQLKLVHDASFVDGLLAGTLRNQLTGHDPAGAAAACWSVGGFIAAARSSRASGFPSAHIGSRFHHAGFRRAHAFCTFNGLMVAAAVLKGDGHEGRIGILDLDAHFGDGTQSIVTELNLSDDIGHYSFAHQMLDPEEVNAWLDELPGAILEMHRSGVTILFYNAGVDPHRDDPMVRGVMTTDQIRRRERIVFETCKALSIPVCWMLAGGYQKPLEKVVALHGLAMEECLKSL